MSIYKVMHIQSWILATINNSSGTSSGLLFILELRTTSPNKGELSGLLCSLLLKPGAAQPLLLQCHHVYQARSKYGAKKDS